MSVNGSKQPFRNQTEYLASLADAVKRLERQIAAAQAAMPSITQQQAGYTGGDIIVDGKLEIPSNAPSLTNQQIIDAIFGWAMSYLTSDAAAGQKNVNVVDASRYVVGNVVTVADATHSEQGVLADKIGNTLVLESNLASTYYVSQSGYARSWIPTPIAGVMRPLRFTDQLTEQHLDHFLITSSENYNAPLHFLDQGWVCRKDGAFGGFVSAQQGAFWYGHGLNTPTEAPKDILGHTNDQLLTANASAGQKTIQVANPIRFLIGVPMILADDNHSEAVILASKNATYVTTQSNLQHSYTVAAHAHLYEPYYTKWITKADGVTLANERMHQLQVAEIVDLNGNPFDFGGDSGIQKFTVSGSVAQYRIVSVVGDHTVAQATVALRAASIGVTQEAKTSGNIVDVRIRGETLVTAGETLAPGDRVTSDDLGRAVKLIGHRHKVGILGSSLAFASNIATGTPSATTSVLYGVSISSSGAHMHTVVGTTGTPSASLNATYVQFQACPSGHSNCQVSGYAHYSFATDTHTHYFSVYTGNQTAEGAHGHPCTVSSTLVASSGHTHPVSGLPTYIRSVTMFDAAGASFYLGGVLSNTNGAEANVYTDYAAEPFMRAIVVQGATVGNLAQIIIA